MDRDQTTYREHYKYTFLQLQNVIQVMLCYVMPVYLWYTQYTKFFPTRPDRSWVPPSLLYNGYRVFPGVKVRTGHAADHLPPSSAEVLEE
jgi:hypothetical protein